MAILLLSSSLVHESELLLGIPLAFSTDVDLCNAYPRIMSVVTYSPFDVVVERSGERRGEKACAVDQWP